MVRHFRFHGRGGEGVKLASRIVSRAAYLAGFAVQDSPLYGAERRGAPVVAFTRVSRQPIRERGYIASPDITVVMDESLLGHPDAGVLDGIDASGVVLVNSAHGAEALRERYAIAGRTVACDVSAIALEVLGRHVLSAPMAGGTIKAAALATWDRVSEAVRIELSEADVPRGMIERNLAATRRVFDAVPEIGPGSARMPEAATGGSPFVIPRLSARFAVPTVDRAQTSARRTMDGWRVYRPEIDRARCTRCILCFALCPEGAITLDDDRFPVVDYGHCKGCLVCVTECPPKAIREVREDAA